MENPVKYITKEIVSYFIVNVNNAANAGENAFEQLNDTDIIKFSNSNFKKLGDVSIVTNIQKWQILCAKFNFEMRTDCIKKLFENTPPKHKDIVSGVTGTNVGAGAANAAHINNKKTSVNEFLTKASTWLLPVDYVKIQPNDRIGLYFQRRKLIKDILYLSLFGNDSEADGIIRPYGHFKKNPNRLLQIRADYRHTSEILSNYRTKIFIEILGRILRRSDWTVVDVDIDGADIKDKRILYVTVRDSTSGTQQTDAEIHKTDEDQIKQFSSTLHVGPVLEPKTRKVTNMSGLEYVALRSNDMLLLALHKYGVRVKQDPIFVGLTSKLGQAAVTVDLFEVRQSSPVQIIRTGIGSTRGASFILYNSARLETLTKKFNLKIEQGLLEPLPPFNNVNTDLLSEEDEWKLIFGYILQYPCIIQRCVEQIEKGQCAIHLIVRFLNGFVTAFSGYYHRSQILLQRKQLTPVVYARMYLVKAVRNILYDALELLGIEPVQYM